MTPEPGGTGFLKNRQWHSPMKADRETQTNTAAGTRPGAWHGLRFVAPPGIVRCRITHSWEATWRIDWW